MRKDSYGTAHQHHHPGRCRPAPLGGVLPGRTGAAPSGRNTESIAFFKCRGTWLALYPREALAADAGVPTDGSGFSGVTLAHNVPTREEVDALLDVAVGAGATLVKPAQDTFWGGYSGYFADPEGYLWEVAWNPYFEIE